MLDESTIVAMTAALEGQSTELKNAGSKIKVSSMELFTLCNLANLGILSVFCDLEGQAGFDAAMEIDAFMCLVRERLANEKSADGVGRLCQAGVAILAQPRLGKYVLRSGG